MSKNPSWVILGAGNLIFDIIDAIEANEEKVEAVVLNSRVDNTLKNKLNTLIISIDDFKPSKDKKYIFGFLNSNKEQYIKALNKYNIDYVNLIHPTAYIAKSTKLGGGNFIGAGVIIGPNVTIGDYNYFNRGSLIGHDVVLGNMNHVGPGANICGRCKVANKCNFGASSAINDGLSIGSNCIIGSNSTVTKNLKRKGVYLGTPAKFFKS